jgi:hypothetical protein
VQNFSPKDWTMMLDDGYYNQTERIQTYRKFTTQKFFKTKQPWRQFLGVFKTIHNKVVEKERTSNVSNFLKKFLIEKKFG